MKKIGRLHVITDVVLQDRFSHVALAQMAVAGGADTVQFRQKEGSTRALIETAIAMKNACGDVPLIVNDRVDVAIAAEADGVHLGQDDFPIEKARDLLGEDAVIGGTAKDAFTGAAVCCGRCGLHRFWADLCNWFKSRCGHGERSGGSARDGQWGTYANYCYWGYWNRKCWRGDARRGARHCGDFSGVLPARSHRGDPKVGGSNF